MKNQLQSCMQGTNMYHVIFS